jgi:hypothetical protein
MVFEAGDNRRRRQFHGKTVRFGWFAGYPWVDLSGTGGRQLEVAHSNDCECICSCCHEIKQGVLSLTIITYARCVQMRHSGRCCRSCMMIAASEHRNIQFSLFYSESEKVKDFDRVSAVHTRRRRDFGGFSLADADRRRHEVRVQKLNGRNERAREAADAIAAHLRDLV